METDQPKPPRRLDALARWCVIALCVCLVLVFGYAWMILSLNERIDDELARIRSEGYPVTYQEPTLPTTWPADDASGDYESANLKLKSLKLNEVDWQLLFFEERRQLALDFDSAPTSASKLTEAKRRRRAELMKLLELYFADIQRAGTKSQCQKMAMTGLDNEDDEDTGGPTMQSVMMTRGADAINPPDAQAFLESVDAILCLAAFAGRGPSVRESFLGSAFELLGAGLGRVELSDPELSRLADRLDSLSKGVDLPRAAANKRALLIDQFQQRAYVYYYVPPSTFWRIEPVRDAFFELVYHHSGAIQADELACLRQMREEIRIVGLPPKERQKAAEAYAQEDKHLPQYLRIAKNRGTQFLDEINTHDFYDRRIILAKVAIEIARYRLAHAGHLPEKLEDLVPAYLPAVPLDPLTDSPVLFSSRKDIFYYATPKGFTVYIKDQRGPAAAAKPGPGPLDITFRVEFPDNLESRPK